MVLRYSYLKSSAPRDRLKAFITDVKKFQKNMKGYVLHDQDSKDAEFSSFLQEVDPTLLKKFFPEWCGYFSNYHDVDEFCEAVPRMV